LLREVAANLVSELARGGEGAKVCVGGLAARSEAMTFRPVVEDR
jgi:hypothetical protein